MNTFTELIITPNSMRIKGGDLNFADATRLLLSAQKKLITNILEEVPKEEYQEIRSALYDTLNLGYGRLLEDIFPDLHNADITPDSIEAEIAEQDRQIKMQFELAQAISQE